MSQVFISYRHEKPDEDLAAALADALRQPDRPVFIDTQMVIGTEWVAEIDRQIRASAFFVVLLSERSIRSDMVRQEVELAHQLRLEGRLRILPVRVGFESQLPYDLASYLNRIQYGVWRPGDDFDTICRQVVDAVTRAAELPEATVDDDTTAVLTVEPEPRGAPLPAADPRLVMETGTIRLDSPFYVRRGADEQVERTLESDGVTLVVKGVRQSGKSSLLARAHALARQRGHKVVFLDLQRLDEAHLESLRTLMRNLAARVARTLKTETKPADVWDDDLGAKQSFADFLETAVLEPSQGRVLLCLDEVDRLFDRPYRADFFAAVRGWHNERALNPSFEKLDLAIAHATDPALWIENLNESPFNVGTRLRLGDFTAEETAELNVWHGAPLRDDGEIVELRRLVGGHPYLVRQALYELATNVRGLDELRRAALEETGPFGDHLRGHLWALRKNPRIRDVVRRILDKGECDDEFDFQRLLAAGLVTGTSRRVVEVRCELYRDYFRRHL